MVQFDHQPFFGITTKWPDRGSPLGVEMFKFDEHTNLECPSSSSWKMAKNITCPDFFDTRSLRSIEGPFVDRSMHWLISTFRYFFIYSFGMDDEILHKIDLPMRITRTTKFLIRTKLVDLDGRLGLLKRVVEADNFIGIAISVWTLVEKKESLWVKKHTIELGRCLMKHNRPEVSYQMELSFCYMSKGEILIRIEEDKGEFLYLYNIEKKKLVQLEDEPLFKISRMGFVKESMFHHGKTKGHHHHQENEINIMMDRLQVY